MSDKLRVFVSSVQKELVNERIAVLELITTIDPFLAAHCQPVLYEFEPASPDKALDGCLRSVDSCHIFVLLVWREYGRTERGLSITHHEYRRAKELKLPILAYFKGAAELAREQDTLTLLKEIQGDGLKYKRFEDYRQLQSEVRASLLSLLREERGIEPSSDENEIAEHTIEAASDFATQRLDRVPLAQLDVGLARQLVANADKVAAASVTDQQAEDGLLSRGLIWTDTDAGEPYATAAGVVLLADDPSTVFPQCRILADAYHGTEKTSKPCDQEDIRSPAAKAIDRAVEFVQRNTRHPMRVVGLNRVQLDEYPTEALREALVNAVAHRQYELAGQKIMLEVFSDRVVVSSPGMPPKPVTIAKLRSGRYMPCSRNPVIAQGLSFFHRIEERGSGMRRMRDEMLDHGLDPPRLATDTGFFQVVFPGPGGDMDRLRVPAAAVGQLVPPAVEAQLSDRQRQMLALLIEGEELTSRRCSELFDVTRPISAKDFKLLCDLGLAAKKGRGRSTRYVLSSPR